MTIFSSFLERSVEIFIDNFSVFWDFFKECLSSLEEVLKKCEETRLALNQEKCHFMVREEIVLGHKIFNAGLEMDSMKIDVVIKFSKRRADLVSDALINMTPVMMDFLLINSERKSLKTFMKTSKFLRKNPFLSNPKLFIEKLICLL